MAATVQAKINTGAGPTVASAEGGVGYGLADAVDAGSTPVTKPDTAGIAYSWYKTLHLGVDSGGGSTSLSQRKARLASSPTTGLDVFFKDGGDTYTQATSGNKPGDGTGTDGATPSTWTKLSTSFQNWDTTSEAAVNSTRNGNYIQLLGGVSSNYAGGASSGAALPNLELQYLET